MCGLRIRVSIRLRGMRRLLDRIWNICRRQNRVNRIESIGAYMAFLMNPVT